MSGLTHSSAKQHNRNSRIDGYIWLLLLVALGAYAAPWLVNPAISLSPNAYDLAEWASIHPTSRMSTPTLLTTLLLRLPLVCLAFALALRGLSSMATRWVSLTCALLIAVALLPPLEFFTSASGDVNYQQQAILSFLTLIGGTIALSGVARRANAPLVFVSTFIGAIVCIAGLAQGYDLMRQFRLPVQIGMGGVVLTGIFLVIAFDQLQQFRSNAT